MRDGLWKTCLFLLLIVCAVTGCLETNGGSQARSPGVPLPVGLMNLPAGGVLEVNVYMDDGVIPWFSDDIDMDVSAVDLEFVAPEGEHTFTVMFVYFDAEFVREDAEPWELARWVSAPVMVSAGGSLALNVDEYSYADSDADGFSNAEELTARTDPGAPGDFPDVPAGILPDGLWRGETQDKTSTDIIAILRANRIMMSEGELIYDGSYDIDGQGAVTGSVDVYTLSGEKLTPLAQVAIDGARLDETRLVLNIRAGIQVKTVSFTLDVAYERNSALASTAYLWEHTVDRPRYTLAFPIDDNGTLTGASDSSGCLYSGNLDILDERYNIYGATLALVDQKKNACSPFAGVGYTGYASLIPDDDTLLIIVSNGTHAMLFELTKSGTTPGENPRLQSRP